jgi:AraC-like DNA-binding protein
MAIRVYDEKGEHIDIGGGLYKAMEQPLVVERREKFSYPFGDTELVQLIFPGVYILYGDTRMYQSQRLRLEMFDEPDLVEMHFTLSGNARLLNEINGREYRFKPNEHNMHYHPQVIGIADYNMHEQHIFFEVHFTTSFFLELAKDSSPLLMQFAEKIQTGNITELSENNLQISFAMHQCIHEIMNNKLAGGLKLLFLQSKCIELLALQAQMYEDSLCKSSSIICKSDYDKGAIHYAKDYLTQHAQQPPSLTELAKIVGVNEFKLKQGFREVFNTTVFGYLSDYKLNQARELLLGGALPIKEIAEQLGYSSVQHFNNAFRKKFGVPPGKVRK